MAPNVSEQLSEVLGFYLSRDYVQPSRTQLKGLPVHRTVGFVVAEARFFQHGAEFPVGVQAKR